MPYILFPEQYARYSLQPDLCSETTLGWLSRKFLFQQTNAWFNITLVSLCLSLEDGIYKIENE